jgi:DUF2934 family protein
MSSIGIVDSSTIHHRAYAYWLQRGCPEGSSEQDWLAAEQELMHELEELETAKPAPVLVEAPVAAPRPSIEKAAPPRPRVRRFSVTSTSALLTAQAASSKIASPSDASDQKATAGSKRRRATR